MSAPQTSPEPQGVPDGILKTYLAETVTLEQFVADLARLVPHYGHYKVGMKADYRTGLGPPVIEVDALHPEWVFISDGL